ncbi:MAG: proton-conducting transporter membrane subunit [Nitrososphaerota archaeon]
MEFTLSPLYILIILTAISPILAYISRRFRVERLMDVYSVAGLMIVFYFAIVQMLDTAFQERVLTFTAMPRETASVIFIDKLSSYVIFVFVLVGLASALFSIEYIKERKAEYYPLLLTMITGMVGVASSGDFVTFFIFWEVMSLSAYALVAFRYKSWEAVEASLKYLIISSAGTAAILFALSLMYGIAGTLNMSALSTVFSLRDMAGEVWSYIILALLLAGLGVNAAMVPFHSWLPDAHPAAPSPISAMLSGVVIKTGIYAMFRVLAAIFPSAIYNWGVALALYAAVTMTVGNLMAMLQEDIKRLLAFSSIAHIGYIVFGISLATANGLAGSLLHVLNHATMKGLLFLSAGAFIHAVGTRNLDELSGIGRKMPISGITFAIGAFSLAGIPGLSAFVSEFQIITASLEAGMLPFTIVMILNVLIGVAYYLRVVQIIFLKPLTPVSEKAHEASPLMLIPVVALAGLGIFLGIYPSPFLEMTKAIASSLLVR